MNRPFPMPKGSKVYCFVNLLISINVLVDTNCASFISEITFMSRNYLCKLFKEAVNMTIFEYVQRIRMDEACRLLKNSDRKVIDIALEVGYSDIKFFNKIFKRITSKTPGKYRMDKS